MDRRRFAVRLEPPFAHLNLRFNPFGELDREARARLAVVDVAPLATLFGRRRFAVQFVGQPGRGKTTHLLALHARFPGAVYVQVRAGTRPRVPRGRLRFVDSVDLLPRRARARLFRRSHSLSVTTHRDLSTEIEQSDLPLTTVTVGAMTPERLDEIIRRRIEWARRGAGPLPVVPPDQISLLLERYDDDVRAIEHCLYDRFQALERIGHVEV